MQSRINSGEDGAECVRCNGNCLCNVGWQSHIQLNGAYPIAIE
jgi:hypothetical protein